MVGGEGVWGIHCRLKKIHEHLLSSTDVFVLNETHCAPSYFVKRKRPAHFSARRKNALKDAIFGDRKSACRSQTRVRSRKISWIPWPCAGCLLRTLPFTWQSRKRRPSICAAAAATRQSKHELFCEYNRSSALPLDRSQVCNVRERHRCLVQLMRQLSHRWWSNGYRLQIPFPPTLFERFKLENIVNPLALFPSYDFSSFCVSFFLTTRFSKILLFHFLANTNISLYSFNYYLCFST